MMLSGLMRWTGQSVLDGLLPPTCPCCDTRVLRQGQLCPPCFTGISFVTAPNCVRCGVPFASDLQGGAEQLCPRCAERPPLFRQARAALRYDSHARQLILPLKHADRTELVAVLAPMMARAGAKLLAEADVLVAVPLHRRRLRQRKYNQAALLAVALGRLSGRPVMPDALRRVRQTAPLDDKSAEERAQEVSGSVDVRARRAASVSGARVLLVDDVMTSGATANVCAAALLGQGALSVDVLTAARVPDPRLR